MSPEDLVGLAIEVAEEGLAAGELPIGAVVFLGDEIIGRAHAGSGPSEGAWCTLTLLAMEQADRVLGWRRRDAPLQVAVNLEPCLMRLGTAMVLEADHVYYGLEAPGDGAASLAQRGGPPHPTCGSVRYPR